MRIRQGRLLQVIMATAVLTFISCEPCSDSRAKLRGPIPGMDANSDYMIYYGDWDDALVRYAENFDLVILHPHSNIDKKTIDDIQDGKDNHLGTRDDIYVIAYISVGEEHPGPLLEGNGRGPVTWDGEKFIYKNKGAASYYLDADDDDEVDVNGTWKSYYVNAGDTTWQSYLKSRSDGLDYIANDLGAHGFFLDTVDSASPWHTYPWMLEGMSNLIEQMHNWYPDQLIMANRGLFYFMDDQEAYQYNIRPFINAVMFESYYSTWNWEEERGDLNPWFEESHKPAAIHVNRESAMLDGFTVVCLDYFDPQQADYVEMVNRQQKEVALNNGWLNCITDVLLKSGINQLADYKLNVNE